MEKKKLVILSDLNTQYSLFLLWPQSIMDPNQMQWVPKHILADIVSQGFGDIGPDLLKVYMWKTFVNL